MDDIENHLIEIIKIYLKEKPKNPLNFFETFSKRIDSPPPYPGDPHRFPARIPTPPSTTPHAETMGNMVMLNRVGHGLNNSESVFFSQLIQSLINQTGMESVSAWGLVRTSGPVDYHVAQAGEEYYASLGGEEWMKIPQYEPEPPPRNPLLVGDPGRLISGRWTELGWLRVIIDRIPRIEPRGEGGELISNFNLINKNRIKLNRYTKMFKISKHGDQNLYTDNDKSNSVIVIESTDWPGTVFVQDRRTGRYFQFYVGFGMMKDQHNGEIVVISPPPVIQSQPVDQVEMPEPHEVPGRGEQPEIREDITGQADELEHDEEGEEDKVVEGGVLTEEQ
jgi:hypothetical protein